MIQYNHRSPGVDLCFMVLYFGNRSGMPLVLADFLGVSVGNLRSRTVSRQKRIFFFISSFVLVH